MIINETIRNILATLGIAEEPASCEAKPVQIPEMPKKSAPKAEKSKLPDDFVSCRYSDLLAEVKYFPNGDAPTEHNALWSIADKHSGKKCHWFCSDKPVGYVTPDGEVVSFKYRDSEEVRKMNAELKIKPEIRLQNAFERYKMSVAKKWAIERDWIPEYRYTLENLESEVGLCVQEMLVDGVDRTKITKKCFDRLDDVYKAFKEYKTVPKEEVCNSAERFMYATLFTGDVNTLHRLESLEGDELPLPTVADLEQFSERELEQFKKIKVVFDRTKNRHNAASIETWMSAQCYALNMPTRSAGQYIYGDRAVGKKKYRRCEVAYSRQANQVFTWLLEEIELMFDEGLGDGLDKWLKIVERSRAIAWCENAYKLTKKYGLMSIEENSPQEKGLLSLIIVNPFKVKEFLEKVIADAEAKHDCNLFGELDGTCFADDITKNEVAFGLDTSDSTEELVLVNTSSTEMPF